jgi:hypothetical protein
VVDASFGSRSPAVIRKTRAHRVEQLELERGLGRQDQAQYLAAAPAEQALWAVD